METSIRFSDCSKEWLADELGLKRVRDNAILNQWIEKSNTSEIEDFEMKFINRLQNTAIMSFDSWNEIELIENFIAPIFALVDFNTDKFKIFSERKLKGIVDGIELFGEPDTLIATGQFSPKVPYFCFNEYKRQEDSKGDAAGQALAAMLVAQEINQHTLPVYGIYVVGRVWNFMILKDKEYCISKSFAADDEEIFDIFKLLKALKDIIISYTE